VFIFIRVSYIKIYLDNYTVAQLDKQLDSSKRHTHLLWVIYQVSTHTAMFTIATIKKLSFVPPTDDGDDDDGDDDLDDE